MSIAKKIIGGAGVGAVSIGAALVARTLVRRFRMRRARSVPVVPVAPVARDRGVRSDAPGAYFPERPVPLGAAEGAPSRADLGDPSLGGPNQQPYPGPQASARRR